MLPFLASLYVAVFFSFSSNFVVLGPNLKLLKLLSSVKMTFKLIKKSWMLSKINFFVIVYLPRKFNFLTILLDLEINENCKIIQVNFQVEKFPGCLGSKNQWTT